MPTSEQARAARKSAQSALHKAAHEAREEAQADAEHALLTLNPRRKRRKRNHWRGVAEGLARLILAITPAGASE